MLTHERLLELLVYKPETGEFIRRVAGQKPIHGVGTRSGHKSIGYWQLSVDGKPYWAARLAWFYMTGSWPTEQVDHRDLNRANDQWDNLRLATRSENQRNKGIYSNNKTGFKGVYYRSDRGIYYACIQVNRKPTYLCGFATALAASQAREAMLGSLHGEFARSA